MEPTNTPDLFTGSYPDIAVKCPDCYNTMHPSRDDSRWECDNRDCGTSLRVLGRSEVELVVAA